MKELLQLIYKKEVDSFYFKQDISVVNKKYTDGEIYETESEAYEPCYKVLFADGTSVEIELSEILTNLFIQKHSLKNS